MIRTGFLLCIALMAPIVADAQRQPRRGGGPENAHPLLVKAMQAQPNLRFTGTRRVLTRLGPEARQNVEQVWQDGRRLRVEFAEGSSDFGQIIVVADGQRQHYFPQTNEIQVRPARFEEPLGRLMDFGRGGRRGVRVQESNGGSVAGQRTTLLSFTDPSGNVMGRLWIAPENGMVMKREMMDPSGRLVGSMEFVSVNMRPTFQPNDFRIVRRGAKVLTQDDLLERQAKRLNFRPIRLPSEGSGYQLDSVRVVPLGDGRNALAQTYVGGQGRRLTLFMVRGQMDSTRLRRSQGQLVASATRTVGDLTLVLIGNLEEADLRRLLEQAR